MKAILCLIAILAVASARLNAKEFYTGFTEELEFTPEQHAEAKACAVEVATVARTHLSIGKAALQAKLLGFLFADDAKHRDTILAVAEFLQTSFPKCQQFAQSFASIFAEASLTEDEHYVPRRQLVNYRLRKHASYLVSSFVRLYDEIKESRSEDAGTSVANILEVLTGIEHPRTIVEYIQEFKQPVEIQVIETDRFVHQAINAAIKELTHGKGEEVPMHRVKDLIEAVQGFFVAHLGVQMQLRNANSVVEREVIILGAVRDLVKIAAVIGENVQLILAPYAESLHLTSRRSAFRVAQKYLHNYYLNLPYIEVKAADIAMGIRAHQPAAVGHAAARFIQLIAGNYHNHGFEI